MASKTLLLAAAVAVTFTGSATASDVQPTSDKVTVCHRTGAKTTEGRFRGHLLTLPTQAIPGHKGHGDVVVVSPELAAYLQSTGGCEINARGDLYDANGGFIMAGPGPSVAPKGPEPR